MKCCCGNPLLCLQFFVNLLHNNFLEVDAKGKIIPSKKFLQYQKINDWSTVPVPRIAIKINCALFDKFLSKMIQNPNKRPGELENAVKALVILKAATTLGEEFELNALKAINPLRQSETEKSLH